MLRQDPRSIESWRGLLAVVCAKRVSIADVTILPLIVGGLMDSRSLTASQAGLLSSVELIVSSVAAAVTSMYLARAPLYRVTALAVVTVASTQLLSAITANFPAFVLLRLICGCAAGVIGAAITSTIATAKNPDRTAGMILIAGGISGLLIMLPITWANARWGLSGVFSAVSLLSWLTLLVVRWVPFAGSGARDPAKLVLRWKGRKLAIPALLAFVVWGSADGALSAFIERFGKTIDLNQTQIGLVLSLLPIALLCGGGSCVWLGMRFGRTKPLAISILAQGLIVATLPSTETLTGFGALLFGWTFFSTFAMPYVFGLLASLDEHGRWVGLLAAASPIATAVGPLVGGLAMEFGGFGALATVAALAYALLFAVMVPVSIRASMTNALPRNETPGV